MVLFKKYYFFFFIILIYSFIFSLDSRIDNIINFSSIDFSTIDNSEFQFSFGIQSNDLVDDLYFFSIDKLFSNNLFFSMKLSKYNNENFEIYNQNSLSYSPNNTSFNCLFSINHLSYKQKINNWINFGILFDYKIKKKMILLVGSYFDIAYFDDKNWKNMNYYIGSKFKLINNITSLVSIKYNPNYSIINQSLEFSVGL